MSPPSIGVIGLGHMAQALIEPLITSGSVDPDQVTAVVGRPESVAALKQGVFGVRHSFR